MVLDGILLRKVVVECVNLVSSRLTQIYQVGKGDFLLRFSDRVLGIFLTPPHIFVALKSKQGELSQERQESQILNSMRHKLKGLPVRAIHQHGLDRILTFVFSGTDQFGESKEYRLHVEILGPNSNLILTREDSTILQVLNERVTQERTLLPGASYSPPVTSKLSLEVLSNTDVSDFVSECSESFERELSSKLQGFSRKLAGRLVELAGTSQGILEDHGQSVRKHLARFLVLIKKHLDSPRVWIRRTSEEPLIDPAPFEDESGEYSCVHVSKALLDLKMKRKVIDAFLSAKKPLEKRLNNELKRVRKLRDRLDDELSEVIDSRAYRKMGELLTANLYRLREKLPEVSIEDWETGETVTIKLDEHLTPSENAQLFFKYHEKAKRKKFQLTKRLRHLENEEAYLLRMIEMLGLADNMEELAEIRQEAIEYGLIKESSEKRKKVKRSSPREFSHGNHMFLVGKNNLQNDELTRSAAHEDIWFHARGTAGSHVILKRAGKEPTGDEILFGARLAARFSKARFSSNVPVDYTECRNVWKPKGTRPGFVLYRNEKTLYVEPLEVKEQEEST